MNKVRRLILNVLSRNPKGMSVADIIAETGLSYTEVLENINTLSKLNNIQLKVTESGNILYYPDNSRENAHNYAPSPKPGLLETTPQNILNCLISISKIFFYSVLSFYFIISSGFIIVVSFLIPVGSHNYKKAREARINMLEGMAGVIRLLIHAAAVKKPVNKNNNKKRIVKFILSKKGVISLPELISFTGSTLEGANKLINILLIKYSGIPFVTRAGTLVFQFPILLEHYALSKAPEQPCKADTGKKENHNAAQSREQSRTILIYLALFNMFYGLYFALAFYPFSFLQPYSHAHYTGIVLFLLVILPLSFSVLFLIFRAVSGIVKSIIGEARKTEHLRQLIYSDILKAPESISTALFPLIEPDKFPKNAGIFIRSTLDELAVLYGSEIDALDDNNFIYHFKELNRHINDVNKFRKNIHLPAYLHEEIIYDSGA